MRLRGLIAGALVAALTPAFVVTEAHASAELGSSVSLRASRQVIDEGETTVISGHARGFAPGSKVRLARLRLGEWVRLDTTTLPRSHDFRFLVRPPHGHKQFRVSVTDPDGRRVAKQITIRVRWTPAIDAVANWRRDAPGDYTLVVRGSTTYAGEGRARISWEAWDESGDDWDIVGWSPPSKVVDGRFRVTGFLLPGTVSRVRLPGDGAARKDAAAEFVVPPFGLAPLRFQLNDPAGTGHPSTSSFVDNLIDLPAGQQVTLHGAERDDYRAILDPDGDPLPITQGRPLTVTVTTTSAGRYTIRRHPGGSGPLYASTPKVYTGELDTPLTFEPDVPGQFVDVRFPAGAGEIVTVGSDVPWGEVLDPAGEPVLKPAHVPFGLPLPVDGTYTMRYNGGSVGQFDLRRIFQATAEVDGPEVALPAGDLAVLTIPARAGEPFFLRSDVDCLEVHQVGAVLHDPQHVDASWLYDVTTVESGSYRLFLPTRDADRVRKVRAVSSTLLPTSVDGAPVLFSAPTPRCHVVRTPFPGSAGQVVRLSAEDSQDELWQWAALMTADGHELRSLGGNIYRLPADGEYAARWSTQYQFGPEEPWTAALAVTSVTPRPMPEDGSLVSLASDTGTDGLLGHVDVPSGTRITVTLSTTQWPPRVDIHAPDGSYYGWVGRDRPTATFTVNQAGGAYLYASTSDTSTATMTITGS